MKRDLTESSYVDHMASTGEMKIRRFEVYEIRMKCFITEAIVRKHKKSFNSGKQRCCIGLCTEYEIKETYFVTALSHPITLAFVTASLYTKTHFTVSMLQRTLRFVRHVSNIHCFFKRLPEDENHGHYENHLSSDGRICLRNKGNSA